MKKAKTKATSEVLARDRANSSRMEDNLPTANPSSVLGVCLGLLLLMGVSLGLLAPRPQTATDPLPAAEVRR